MVPHKLRVKILGAVALLSFIAAVALTVVEMTDSLIFGLAIGAFGTSIAGLFDALGVERRRRDPARPGLVDDVVGPSAVNHEDEQPGPRS